METIIREGDTITKTTVETIDLVPLRAELVDIEKQLIELEKEPDEIVVANEGKFLEIQTLIEKRDKLNNLLE